MSKKNLNKKLKAAAWILNIFSVIALIFVELSAYEYLSYRNYLILDYIPQKRIIIYQAIIIVLVLIPFFLKGGKKRTIASIVLSSILFLALTSAGIGAMINDAKIKDFIDKTDKTIEEIVENSKLSTDEYGVYVLKTDEAEELEDIVSYKLGYNTVYSSEDVQSVITDIEQKLDTQLNTASYGDPARLAESILKGDTRAIILNQSFIIRQI